MNKRQPLPTFVSTRHLYAFKLMHISSKHKECSIDEDRLNGCVAIIGAYEKMLVHEDASTRLVRNTSTLS